MKRCYHFVLVVLLIIIAFVTFNSCNKQEKEIDVLQQSFFRYNIPDMKGPFVIGDDFTLYYLKEEEKEETTSYHLYGLNMQGEQIYGFDMGEEHIYAFDVVGDKVYYVTSRMIDTKSFMCFMEYSKKDGSLREIGRMVDSNSVRQLKILNGKIYIIVCEENRRTNANIQMLIGGMGNSYMGEVLKSIDIKTGEQKEIPVDVPTTFSPTPEGNLMISAYDSSIGYYLILLNEHDGTLSKPMKHDKLSYEAFAMFDEERFLYSFIDSSWFSLSIGDIHEPSKNTELLSDTPVNYVEIEGEYGFYSYIYYDETYMERIRIPDFIRENKTITMASSLISTFTPFGCGYDIIKEFPDDESFALSILAQDPQYDIFILDSRQDFSMSVKKQSSYYPLEEFEYSTKYLEACFPYIKEAATTEDGSIWMIPIDVNIPLILYQKENFEKENLSFSLDMDLEYFVGEMKKLSNRENNKMTYIFNPYMIKTNFFYDYLRWNTDLNQDLFRTGARLLKELHQLKSESDSDGFQSINNMMNNGDYSNFLFNMEYYLEDQLRMLNHSNLSVLPVPKVTEESTYVASTIMLCVNPYSKNMDEALKYINSLCKYLLENNDGIMLEGKDRYEDSFTELYDIYANGEIQFTMPNELYLHEYDNYLEDKIDLEELIQRVNRKIDTYLKE